MTHLIHSEWIKFRSVRSTLITVLLAGVLVLLVAVLQANDAKDVQHIQCESVEQAQQGNPKAAVESPNCGEGSLLVTRSTEADLSALTGGVALATMIFGVLGVQSIGQEYRFNTIRPTFTAAPHRIRVLAAKLVVVAAACSAVAAAMTALCWLVGTAMLDAFSVDGVDRRIALGIILFSALWTMAGMGIGSIVRQPIAGIMILLGYSLIAESLLGAIVDSTQRWLPVANGLQMTYRPDDGGLDLMSVLAGGIYFAAFCALLWAIGAYLVNRRDA